MRPGSGAAVPAPAELPVSRLARLRLLVALDALLVEGSVARAARALDLSASAMSRLLAQLRAQFGDEIVIRSGRGLIPTPFAERLRHRVRAVAAEADALVEAPAAAPATAAPTAAAPPPAVPFPIPQHPPLAASPAAAPVVGLPDPARSAQLLASLAGAAEPRLRLARHIATIGAGPGRARPLSGDEAAEAFGIILDGAADPVQIGALLVAMQYRGVTAGELAGMVRAARRGCPPLGAAAGTTGADIDWPVYRSPRITSPPWFLLAARLVAGAGHRVLLHGFDHGADRIHDGLVAAGIPRCLSLAEARAVLAPGTAAYLPLTAIDPQLQALVALYGVFAMRSPLNLVAPLLNPLAAPVTLVGVPSASARSLQRDAARALGWERLLAVGSHRDLAQATPAHAMPLMLLDHGRQRGLWIPPADGRPRPSPPPAGFTTAEVLGGLWSGALRDDHAVETVVSTAALALLAASPGMSDYPAARETARDLWQNRPRA